MLILIEGADLTGKTTLAGAIEKAWGLEYFHLGPPGDMPTMVHHLKWTTAFADAEKGLVIDRAHWSDHAYSPRYHPENSLGIKGFRLVDNVFLQAGAVAVHATATVEAIESRWERGEDYLDKKDVGFILEMMRESEDMTRLPVFHHEIGVKEVDFAWLLGKVNERSVKK